MVLTAWHGLHLKKLSELVGVGLCVQFVRADGTPRYQRPMWLFWTGPESVALKDLCRVYLWRFAIEHFFSLCQAASRIERQSIYADGLHRSLDVAVRAGFLATSPDARRRGDGGPGLVSAGGEA